MIRTITLCLSISIACSTIAQNPASITITGGQDRVEIGNAAIFEITDELTLEAWVKPDTVQPGWFGRMVDKFSFVDQQGYNMILNDDRLFMEVLSPTGQSRSVYGSIIKDGNWHHVAGTFSGTQMVLYVDGTLDNSDSFSPMTISVSSNPLNIGNGNDGNGYLPMGGKIDEVRVWNTVRSATEIAQYKDSCLTGNEPGLVGYWRLDEGTGTTVQDLTANGNNGMVMAGAAWSTDTEFPADGCTPNSIEEQGGAPDLSIYPNPAADLVFFERRADVLVLDVLGKEMMRATNTNVLDVSGLEAAYYWLRFDDGHVRKLLVE